MNGNLSNHQLKALKEARQSLEGNRLGSNRNLVRLLGRMGFEVRGGKLTAHRNVYLNGERLVGKKGPVQIPRVNSTVDYFVYRYALQTALLKVDRKYDYQV